MKGDEPQHDESRHEAAPQRLQKKTRFAYTAEALKSERILFETRTPPRYGLDVSKDEA